MPSKPFPRCHRTYVCTCTTSLRIGLPVTFSGKLLRAIAPKTPKCPRCGAVMLRQGGTYQGMLSSTWDPQRSQTRQMFAAMIGRS